MTQDAQRWSPDCHAPAPEDRGAHVGPAILATVLGAMLGAVILGANLLAAA